jgi:hypothetical protein
MALGVFVIANDFTALSVAIPRIEADLHTSLNRAHWVINGYALVFGVLIVTGGRLADLFGRRRMFMIGASIFGVFSLLAGVMPTVELLIVFRALMGVGGAIIWPWRDRPRTEHRDRVVRGQPVRWHQGRVPRGRGARARWHRRLAVAGARRYSVDRPFRLTARASPAALLGGA